MFNFLTTMETNYTFTMSERDQQLLIDMGSSLKFGDVIKSASGKPDLKNQSSNLHLNSRELYKFSGEDADQVYDVRFVMHLIYHSVSPSLLVDCRNFIIQRGMSLTIAGLSSEDDKMRALCYKILERYYNHLESSLQMERLLWKLFLDLIRNSIPTPNSRLPPLFGLFLIRIIDILVHSNDPLYQLIKEFLSGRPKLDISSIEVYDDLISCSDVDKYEYSMRWILTLIRDGVRDQQDIKIIKKLNVIPTIMCLYNSELRFKRANEVILSIFSRITKVKSRGVKLLVRGSAFLPWLDQVLHNHLAYDSTVLDEKSESLSDITKILATIVFNIIDDVVDSEGNSHATLTIELINTYITLYDLILKSGEAQVLAHHMFYAITVLKIMKKDEFLSDDIKVSFLKMLRMRLPYFDNACLD